MSLLVEIPQCPVCHEPFGQNSELVRPNGCGHVLCKPCAENIMKRMNDRCPLGCANSRGNGAYKPVFVGFGMHDVSSLSKSSEENQYRSTVDGHDFSAAELETVARLLNEIAKSSPEAWTTANTGRNNKGLIFLRACRLLHRIGDGIQRNDSVQDFLHQLSVTLGALKELYDSMAEVIHGNASVRDKLESMNGSLRTERDSLKRKLQQNEAYYTVKLASQHKLHAERESKLRVELNAMHDKWRDEKARRTVAEESRSKLESKEKKWRSSSARYRRKYELEKLKNERWRNEIENSDLHAIRPECRQDDAQSDDSLEIESPEPEAGELVPHDGTIEVPPSSGSLAADLNVLQRSSSYVSPVDIDPKFSPLQQPLAQLSSEQNVRKMGRAQSVGTLNFLGGMKGESSEPTLKIQTSFHGTKCPVSRTQSCSQIPPSRLHTSDATRPDLRPKSNKEHLSRPVIDPELLEICPDLAGDLSASNCPSNEMKNRKPQSARPSKAAGILVNPLATRQTSQNFHGPQRKKQRLTMVAGDNG